MNQSNAKHWDNIYQSKELASLGWYQANPEISLQLLKQISADSTQATVDIGCGLSYLVDHLIDLSFTDITLFDLSQSALDKVKTRLANRGEKLSYIQGNITKHEFNRQFDIWHDRAVFHFLTDENDRQAYLENLTQSLSKGGKAIIGTFSLDGPNRCSGLDVVQYNDEKMESVIGGNLRLEFSINNTHTKPNGEQQEYQYFVLSA